MISVVTPNGSSKGVKGGKLDIKWTDTYDPAQVHIYLREGFNNPEVIVTGLNNENEYSWDIPADLASGSYNIEVADASDTTISHISQLFPIEDMNFTVTGGDNDTVVAGEPHTFFWEHNLQHGFLELAYETDPGNWVPIDTVALYEDFKTWTTPSGADYLPSTRVRIKSTLYPDVIEYVDNIIIDENFELAFVTAGGTTTERGTPFELKWDHNLNKGDLLLEYYDTGNWYKIADLPYYETSLEWLPPAGMEAEIQVRVRDTVDTWLSDTISNLSVQAASGSADTKRLVSYTGYNGKNNPTEAIDANGTGLNISTGRKPPSLMICCFM